MFSLLKIGKLKAVFLEGKSHCRRHAYLLTWRSTEAQGEAEGEYSSAQNCDIHGSYFVSDINHFLLYNHTTIPIFPVHRLYLGIKDTYTCL